VLLIAHPCSIAIDILGVAYMISGSISVGCSLSTPGGFISPLKLPAAALATYQIGLAMLFPALVTNPGDRSLV